MFMIPNLCKKMTTGVLQSSTNSTVYIQTRTQPTMFLIPGFCTNSIQNAGVSTVVGLDGNCSTNGTSVIVQQQNPINHLWLIEAIPHTPDTYIIQNTRTGLYLDIAPANGLGNPITVVSNGTELTGAGVGHRLILSRDNNNQFRIQTVNSQACVDLKNCGVSTPTIVECGRSPEVPQQWVIQRVGQHNAEPVPIKVCSKL
ncbi:hypothetical protein E1B28_008156 [Marasmius oreades]|uniref:Ricin B lectin domain-containing protein n=1 Tax=Marasmius oreades TaxID=181124 RepID=A0A9P7RXX9_9AGAR|nr:uncharacterized protein E1B28_008156 [Marasmius oreades]KAG7091755.1 hypothetical protein E1B28_008156 [Marasmius oreades]